MTSQVASSFVQSISLIELTPLSIEEGSRLLLRLVQCDQPSEIDVASAKGVSEMVGGLPIAIAHMAGYMFTSKTSPKELQEKLTTGEAYDIWLKPKSWTTPLYEQRLDKVWQIALRELPESAVKLLFVLSMLNPDAIPDEMLDKWGSMNLNPSHQRSVKIHYYRPYFGQAQKIWEMLKSYGSGIEPLG